MLTRLLTPALALLSLAAVSAPASAQQPLFRSDLPLFTRAAELSPHSFSDGESFGCESIMHFGDYVSRSDGEYDQDEWWRFVNYGVIHCALIFYDASDRDWLNYADHSYAWLARLGSATSPEGEALQLFALQIGASGGSQYLLLARPHERGANEWRLLDAECPPGSMRETDSIDIWRTDYCAIDGAETLRAMANAAALRPPAEVFIWVGRAPDIESFLPPAIENFARRVRECRDLADLEPTSDDGRQWAEEAAVDYACASLTDEATPLSARYSGRPEIAALINALIEQGGFVPLAPSPMPPPPAGPPSSRR